MFFLHLSHSLPHTVVPTVIHTLPPYNLLWQALLLLPHLVCLLVPADLSPAVLATHGEE